LLVVDLVELTTQVVVVLVVFHTLSRQQFLLALMLP
jgi:hypothetical protein